MRKKDARPMDDARRSLNRLSAEPTERRPVRWSCWFPFDDRSPITKLPEGVRGREREREGKSERASERARKRETGHAHPRAAENSERPREEEKEEGTGRERISRNNC